MLNVFLFERASKKNADSLGLHIKKSLFPARGIKKNPFSTPRGFFYQPRGVKFGDKPPTLPQNSFLVRLIRRENFYA